MDGILYFTYILSILFTVALEVEGSSLRLVGGAAAPREFGRFHASLQNLTGYHVCGGAVISTSHIVTAAHCVLGAEPQYIKAVVGTTDLKEGGKQYDVVSIFMNENYNSDLRTNDIAILKVNGNFDEDYVQIIELEKEKLVENDIVVLSGFGAHEPNGESSTQMHVLNLTVFSQEICIYAMRYTRKVFDTMFCTFTRIGEGTCHGDSGGPLIKDGKLVGLVSWGIPCASGFPDVHTRITPYITWIYNTINIQ